MPYGLGAKPAAPQRGWPGGWRDWWEQDDADAAARARAARFAEETERVRSAWRTQPKPTFGRRDRRTDLDPLAEPTARPDG